jgi:heptosyltransferase-3
LSYNIDKIKSVAVLMPDAHMGNLLVSLPVIAALRERFSGRRFTLVVDEAYADLAASIAEPVNLLLLERRKIRGRAITGTARFIGLIKRLRDARPDAVIDLEGGGASALMALFSGAGVRASRATSARPRAYNVRVDITQGLHKVYTYAEVAGVFGADAGFGRLRAFRIKPRRADMDEAAAALKRVGLVPSDPIVCIHAGAGKDFKRWGAKGFAKTAGRLAGDGLTVVFVGGAGDMKITAEVEALTPAKTSSLAGGLTLGGLSALFSISRLCLGNDSGPMHLAAMSGAPVVVLFGPADETRWSPLPEGVVTLRGMLGRCEKCTGEDCALDFGCVRLIEADAVVEAARSLIKNNGDYPRITRTTADEENRDRPGRSVSSADNYSKKETCDTCKNILNA